MYSLNTQSGMLHLEDHGGGSNAEDFERADAADKFMHESGKKMAFCQTCFPDNRNSEVAEEMERLEAAVAGTPEKTTGSPTENTTARGTRPPTLDVPEDSEAV